MTTAEYFGVSRPRRPAATIEFDPGFGAVLVALVTEAWGRFREWRRLRRAVSELRGLDDRMLKDIGVCRSSLYASAHDAQDDEDRGYGLH